MVLKESVVTIVGMGLMGGSLGMALTKTDACREVRALVRREETALDALALRAAHVAVQNPADALPGANLVVVATPVRTIECQVSQLVEFLSPDTTITDMGSVKSTIVEAMKKLPRGIHAVGGHPMCGKEISGIHAADADLFQNKVWAVTPTPESDPAAMALVLDMVLAVGARPVIMSADEHDVVTACISHLPYLLASALVGVAEQTAEEEHPAVWDLASSGFRDTSRVAAGDLTMMMDILCANRENVLLMLDRAEQRLAGFRELLGRGDEEELKKELSEVRKRRAGMFPA